MVVPGVIGEEELESIELFLKDTIGDTHLEYISIVLRDVTSFSFDRLMASTLNMFIKVHGGGQKDIPITTRFCLYKVFWKVVLEKLYKDYLPTHSYVFEWGIEISPYTLALCEFVKQVRLEKEFEVCKRMLNISESQIEDEYEYVLEKLDTKSIGLPVGIAGVIPSSLVPEKRADQLNLLFRLMNFPPLEELAVFFMAYGAHVNNQVASLSIAFSAIEAPKSLGFKLEGAISGAYYNVDHSTFLRLGLDGLERTLASAEYGGNFSEIKNLASKFKGHISDSLICPCCGNDQEITLPEDVTQFKLLIQDRKLSRAVGLLFVDDYIAAMKKRLSEAFSSFFKDLNQTNHPRCLILVEGDSEESSMPKLALKRGLLLAARGIKVYNSKSKQKLEADFNSFREKFPKMKMVCLLDSDAEKERDSIARVIRGNRDKYHLTYIKKGCFEDLFELALCVRILNDIYPEGEEILISDFDASKDFGKNVKRILHEKKRSVFDKVKFAGKIFSMISADEIPAEICEVFEMAIKFTNKNNFIAE